MKHPFPAGGRYEVLGTLGKGGFGVVYRALDREAGREVAIKVSLERADPQRLTRFRREGELTARLDHPGIVKVHSAGEVSGYPYLVYELIEGTSLGAAFPVTHMRRRVELIRDVARALAYAHAQGVVHRDVKAENVLVDAAGQAYVADFGLALAQDMERLTRTGAALGTPTHMSPEQLEGRRERIGPATDVWALGVLLYQALTDRLPFMADSPLELVGQILHGDLRRPSQLNPKAPRELDAVCLKALEREPARRYPEARQLADALDRWLAGEAVEAGGPSGRRPAALALGLAALAGLGWLVLAPDPAGEAAGGSAAVAEATPSPASRSREADARAEGLLGELLDEVASRSQLTKLRQWASDHPGHPAADRAWERVEALEAVLPIVLGGGQPHTAKGYWLDEDHLLVSGGGTLSCYALAEPAEPVWSAQGGAHEGFALAPDRKVLTLSRKGAGQLVFDVARREARPIPGAPGAEVAAFAADGRQLVLATSARIDVRAWPGLEVLASVKRQEVRCVAVSQDGLVALGGGSWAEGLGQSSSRRRAPSWLSIYRLPSLELVFDEPRETPPTALCFDRSGAFLYEANSLGALTRLRLAKPSERLALSGIGEGDHEGFSAQLAHHSFVDAVICTDELLFSISRLAVFGEGDSELRAWRLVDGAHLRVIEREVSMRSLALSPAGERFAVGYENGTVEVYRARVDTP